MLGSRPLSCLTPACHTGLEHKLQASAARYAALANQLARVGIVASGSLALRSHRSGKENCACGGDPPRLHGPYWHLTTKVDGKTVNRRLSESEARRYQEWIGNDRRLRELIAELRTAAQEVIELTLSEAKAASEV